jgi:protein gp37
LNCLLITKRPQNILKMLPPGWDEGWPNVWLGVSVENMAEAKRRIPSLLSVPAVHHFGSCEPLLEPLDLTPWLGKGKLD